MKSITIHGLDENLEKLIKQKALFASQSLNKTIKEILRESLGMGLPVIQVRRREFSEFLGIWDKKEAQMFNKNIKEMEKVDQQDWQ